VAAAYGPLPAEFVPRREARRGVVPTAERLVEVRQDDLNPNSATAMLARLTSEAHAAKPEPTIRLDPNFVPTKTQRRKHQVTWLVYEAAQKEAQLLERQAEARRTKQEVRRKYGW
jgi:proline-rich protein PRCC